MHNKLVTMLTFLFLPSLLHSKGQSTISMGKKPAQITLQEDYHSDKSPLYAKYLQATYHHSKGNINKALTSFQFLLKKTKPEYVYEAYLKLLGDAGLFQIIANIAKVKKQFIEQNFKDNIEIKLLLAQAYSYTGQDDAAAKLFAELKQAYPENSQVAYYDAVSFLKKNNLPKALASLDESLKKPSLKSKHFLFHFLKSKIYFQMQKHPQAMEAIKKSLELYPKFDKGWLFKAVLMEQTGKIQEAVKGYKAFLDLVGRDESVEKQLIRLFFSQEKFSQAATFLRKLKQNKPEYYFDLALVEFKAQEIETALENINKALAMNPKFGNARLLKVEILLALNKFHEARNFMKEWIVNNPENTGIIHTFMLLKSTKVPLKDLIGTLEEVVKEGKTSLAISSALADLYLETGQSEDALKHYKSILNLTNDNQLKSHVLFQIGYIYFSIKQFDKVEKMLKKAIDIKPTYPSAYNLLAYYYAQINQKLPHALELVDKALHFSPACHYYLDTKGLILMRLGKKQEAIKILQSALKLAPHDKIIQSHLRAARAQKNKK